MQMPSDELKLANIRILVLENNLNECIKGNIDLQSRLELLAINFNELSAERDNLLKTNELEKK